MRRAMKRTSGRFSSSKRSRSWTSRRISSADLGVLVSMARWPPQFPECGVRSTHHPQRLHGNIGGNLRRREHHDARDKGFEETPEMKAHRTVAEEHGGAQSYAVSDETLQTFEDGAQRPGGAAGGAFAGTCQGIDMALEFLFDGGIEGQHF